MMKLELLRTAIAKRQVVEFFYEYHHRLVEPYALGVDRDLRDALLGFQFGGRGEAVIISDWNLFLLDRMHNLKVGELRCHEIRRDYVNNDPRFIRIYCQHE